ncbi:TetR/AcrR family transcriptional regulator C-terminal domain-containing protein [Jiangella asiatica]|uniref:TetR/AcrR family transcriptional regulator C-terminal domain-containing protein n=1 Tax=Jiangella asiatica TaxID=2530372 RepID=UPI00193D878D|nr:TetR/AcrR family transcriptional regulator C-terminal domain-containing protein [Jiangella asiatica]
MTPSRGRGQRVGLTRSAILRAAIRLADRDGPGALTMRQIAAELDVEAMTLYHYVPNKTALLDGVVEHIIAETAPPHPAGASWRATLREFAGSLYATLTAHPNVIPLLVTQPAMTTRNLATTEAVLVSLQAAGFPPRRGLQIVHAVTGFVLGHALVEATARPSGTRDTPNAATTADAVDRELYPLMAEALSDDGAVDATTRFTVALDALLSGFDAS